MKAFLQNLVILQEYSPQQSKVSYVQLHIIYPCLYQIHLYFIHPFTFIIQMYSKAHSMSSTKTKVLNAVECLSKAVRGIADDRIDIEHTLHENCYVMSKDKVMGATWQHQPKHIAAVELGQCTNLEMLDDNLFQLVSSQNEDKFFGDGFYIVLAQ